MKIVTARHGFMLKSARRRGPNRKMMIASGMRKYWVIFKISWQKELEYRFNFFLGRLRNIIVMLLLYYVWYTVTKKSGKFAGYSQIELITYVFGINILRAIIFGAQSKQVASDINDGSFSAYLIMPINHFTRTFSAEFAQRSLSLVTALAEVILFSSFLKVNLIFQRDAAILALFSLSIALASVLYFLFSYAMSLLAFWSREAMGPRFLFDWFLEFASGAYFPIDILSPALASIFGILPFASIMYLPMQIYLGRTGVRGAWQGIALQSVWIVVFFPMVLWVWRRGLNKYTGEGI
ncbi:MAG TPA: ABC-2 family transporter protein [Nitrospirota bacterium]|nr:ABC-2 family transporter protein [Nitrospirota bacterium]